MNHPNYSYICSHRTHRRSLERYYTTRLVTSSRTHFESLPSSTSICGDTSTRLLQYTRSSGITSDPFTVNHRPRQRANDLVDTIAAPAHAHTRARQLGRSHAGPITRTVVDRQDAFANRTAYTPRSLSPTGWAFCIYAVNCLVAPCSLVFFPLRCNTSSAYCHTDNGPSIESTPSLNCTRTHTCSAYHGVQTLDR